MHDDLVGAWRRMKRVDDDTIFVFVQLILCEYLMRFFTIVYNYLSKL
jgi:hypothetical protein